ncbi:MAG: hypothetical protein FJW92_02770 [Actinobacteria bacterium]|nr:hypothetical protein [Actinomycetota bacterium]
MSSSGEAPLKGHWPTAFALGGTLDEPALVPLNYTANVLAGDEYCVPVSMPPDATAAEYIESLLDHRGWARIGPSVGALAVAAMLSIPEFADRPIVVADEAARSLSELSPEPRACITLGEIQDAAREVMPDRDPAARAPVVSGRAIDQARALGFAVYWAIGDGVTPTRRRKAMAAAGWPESVIEWIAQPAGEPAPG